MPTIPVRISVQFRESLKQTSEKFGLKESDIIRKCLQMGLQQLDWDSFKNGASTPTKEDFFQKQIAAYIIQTYCLLERFVKNNSDEGPRPLEMAQEHSEQLLNVLLKRMDEITIAARRNTLA